MKQRKLLTAILAFTILCMSISFIPAAAEDAVPGYIVSGSASGSTYTLDIQITDIFAFTGRLGLVYDTSKLAHKGGDSLSAFKVTRGSGITLNSESLSQTDIISGSEGYIGLGWYNLNGVDALSAPISLVTIDFSFKSGVTAEDIDSSTFMLRVLNEKVNAVWGSPAMLQGKGEIYPTLHEYLNLGEQIAIDFEYEGSDRAPANGSTVKINCVDISGAPVQAEMILGAKTYTTDADGAIELFLAPGEYQYLATSEGFGDMSGVLTVEGETELTVPFVNNAELVAAAAAELEIGYQTGDSADHVTQTLILSPSTDTGVSITWSSSNTAVISNGGYVSLPEMLGETVTLTATLTRGEASEEKSFTVYVCSEEELKPPPPPDPEYDEGGENNEQTKPDEQVKPEAINFSDLAGYEWAKTSIEKMSAAGIIKGTSATTFSPASKIKRGDFVLLLMRMFNTSAAPGQAFADVPTDSYYYEAIAKARTLGIAQGTGDNLFTPEASITRQDMITFVMRALEITGYIDLTDARDDLWSFKDRAAVADYAFDSMSAAVAQGLIVGSDGQLNPTGNTSRAEAAVFIARIYDAHNSRGDSN